MGPKPMQALAGQAERAYRGGHYTQAAALYQQAVQGFLEAGDTLSAAEMRNNQSVALLQGGDAPGALQAASGTELIFAGAGDQRRQALALGNQAAALDALGRLEEALVLYRQSSDLLKVLGDQETRAFVLKNISSLQVRTGHQLEAMASMEAALENQPRLTVRERFLKKLLKVPFQMLRR